MMIIDLKWGLPIFVPFVILFAARLFWFAAGLEWGGDGAEFASGMIFLVGVLAGIGVATILEDQGIKWRVRIGKRNREGR